jgi:hypothetical protein
MSQPAPKPANILSADDPRRIFEKAMARIQQSGLPLRPSQTPIAARKETVGSDHATQTQALTEAARALARIWGVPSPWSAERR